MWRNLRQFAFSCTVYTFCGYPFNISGCIWSLQAETQIHLQDFSWSWPYWYLHLRCHDNRFYPCRPLLLSKLLFFHWLGAGQKTATSSCSHVSASFIPLQPVCQFQVVTLIPVMFVPVWTFNGVQSLRVEVTHSCYSCFIRAASAVTLVSAGVFSSLM